MKWIVAILVLYLASCTNSKRSEIGQFVYVDCFNTIHVDRECASTLAENPKTKEERMANMQGVKFVDTWRKIGVMRPCSYQFCPKCVDDETYKRISAIIERNVVKPSAY